MEVVSLVHANLSFFSNVQCLSIAPWVVLTIPNRRGSWHYRRTSPDPGGLVRHTYDD
jgi:hypothetical protein